jgi:hypothetical protein
LAITHTSYSCKHLLPPHLFVNDALLLFRFDVQGDGGRRLWWQRFSDETMSVERRELGENKRRRTAGQHGRDSKRR